MELAAWLKYLETLHPKLMDLGLERISQVATALHLTQFDCPVITVAGTNGKGSTVALLESILIAAGYRVGSYISPHLLTYNERIRLQGQAISDTLLCSTFEQIESQRRQQNISLSFFEFSTLAALKIFQQAQLDVMILEVGLGGRLDAVNIVDPDLAIISTIALDHTACLGNNREQIGKEKAGIFRAGIPAICGDWETPESVVAHAAQLQVPLYRQGQDFGYQVFADSWTWHSPGLTLSKLPIPKLALQNAATALQAVQLLPASLRVNRNAMTLGLTQVCWPGRFQVVPGTITKIFDVAHNPASAMLLAENLKQQICQGRTRVVIGMLTDKDQLGTLATLTQAVDDWYLADLHTTRGGQARDLASCLARLGVTNHQIFSDVAHAYRQAIKDAVAGDRVVITGSFITVAEVMRLSETR